MADSDKQSSLSELSTKGWVSLQKFARIAGISYPTALSLQRSGKVKAITVGNVHRVYTDEVRRFMEEGNAPTEDVPTSQFRALDNKED